MVLPNTSAWGLGTKTGAIYDTNVEDLKERVCAVLKEAQHNTKVVSCVAFVDETTFYSTERALRIDFLLITARSPAAQGAGVQESIFGRSKLLQRQSPGLVEAMTRSDFRDWAAPIRAYNAGNLSAELERRQWASGKSFWTAVLRAAFKGVGLGRGSKALIRDMTLWDDQLALTVASMNAQAEKGTPILAYCGANWADEGDSRSKQVAANVQESVGMHLVSQFRSGAMRLPADQARRTGPIQATTVDPSQCKS